MTLLLPSLTPARGDVSHLLDRVHHCDAMTLLKALPDASVHLIAADHPYNGVKDDEWDNQWANDDEFIAWTGALCREYRRVLTPNGSLYVFASPRLAARVEVEIGRWFNVLNQVVWRKEQARYKGASVDDVRGYFPQTERIIFAEQFGSDANHKNQDEKLWGVTFAPLQDWFRGVIDTNNISAKAINSAVGTANSGGGMASHYFGETHQFGLPTADMYGKLQSAFPEAFTRSYLDLRREYEDLRRPFNSHPFAPYTDVWDFPTVGHYPGKHPAEKPLAMMEHIVKISSRPSDIVLDCFCGSGTTPDAARRNDRRYIAGDFTAHWADYARRRVSHDYDVMLPMFTEVTFAEAGD